ncbi:bifunctional methylenetetrahydrofolate dehydrogenase/methenyltetrahydrofolate cyclohydrolase FolD [Ruminiclostridium cellulolyticum]|uniref:Bifunctional protein FolD n=1 Tax=Ruminiclostridium cellulolyticum (strain ATCC 35319 / DSM 5812 / JCM 6584 / H10) TaxID=394503 RepID=FOLD_RUMCH|nr:bifunctional methylenetetrahydrofolate dehydrogenase/methenyltetrahydrofolate cyclohydrolase FolD [Ruminiclostridium cellulolyticum]B8I761.1 RecName: Full=Bifunctional protein FolD; Includes: RecName: Full=Methylenetetrahydrofolate dehydrogenase; Includes: RecName: Full=Methenyltetrahydrofolate cyclohydrolase [Ruminiclostridium cellulolyticum H10]ACL74985.1 tetrahydrofolate dehydrogenase/cyclohydrolase [Ruminiclostridium cellulolyticum H10]
MSAKVLNGTELAAKVKAGLKAKIDELKSKGINPGLAVIIVGDDPASRVYVNHKKNDCTEIGIKSFEYALPESTSEEELLDLIETLNNDASVNGILVQLPIPKHINEEKVIAAISPDKDADCFHPMNVGKLMIGKPEFLPCTPAGVVELLEENGIEISGKNCVVVGRSNIVGKPQAILLLAKNATVTICHSKTANIEEVCRSADVLVVAIGKSEFIKPEFVKPGAVVIDVGVSRGADGKLVGDVQFAEVAEIASAITKVTGGVGPMTRAMLMKNTYKAVLLQNGL